MNRFRRASLVLSAILLAALAGCGREDAAAPASPAAAPVAIPAPAAPKAATVDKEHPTLRVQTLDGTTFDLAEHRDRWVIVNFWATWCGPCLKEMPELSALDAMREHIVVLGLAYEDNTPDAMRAFLKQHPVVYPVALVDVYAPPADFDIPRGLPFTYLIAPGGKVVKKYTGPVSARMLEEDIAAAGGPRQG